jgi:putative heme-binding domain-containing protein
MAWRLTGGRSPRKPDAKRKRDSAQLQRRAQPSNKWMVRCGQAGSSLREEWCMTWTSSVLTVAIICLVGGGSLAAQDLPAKNPFEGDPDAIKYGMGLYRGRCADCHGMDARGIRGPDITQVWALGRTDAGLFKTIKGGVPNTEMPANPRISDREAWQLLAYLRTLAAPAPADPPRGNAQNGEKIFRASCGACHRVNGVGGRLGPDLSRVGSARSREAIVLRIRRGVDQFQSGYAPVMVTPQTGPPIRGVKKNEDLFSVQIMDTSERIQGYEKEKMKAVENGTQSMMPAFGPERLSDSDLDDLVRYLETLRGFDPAVLQ